MSDSVYSDDFVLAWFGIIILVYVVMLASITVNYVLQSLALYRIAKRRGLPAPGLAWVPVANVWTIGGIADQYDSTHGIKRKWRVLLITLNCISCGIIIVGFFVMLFSMMRIAVGVGLFNEDVSFLQISAILPGYFMIIIGSVLSMVTTFCTYICVFKVFESCDPVKAVKYFVISLLVPFGFSICLTLCSRRDYGMPAPAQPVMPVVPQEQPMMYVAPVQDFPPQTFE